MKLTIPAAVVPLAGAVGSAVQMVKNLHGHVDPATAAQSLYLSAAGQVSQNGVTLVAAHQSKAGQQVLTTDDEVDQIVKGAALVGASATAQSRPAKFDIKP